MNQDPGIQGDNWARYKVRVGLTVKGAWSGELQKMPPVISSPHFPLLWGTQLDYISQTPLQLDVAM